MSGGGSLAWVRRMPAEESNPEKLTFRFKVGFFML